MPSRPAPPSSGLHSVDQANTLESRLRFLDAEAAKPAIRLAKAWTLERLALRPGAHVLDLGCGAGADAQELATAVGADGRVVGIDIDPLMVEEARRRGIGSATPVEFRQGDIYEIPFADDAFDGVRAERTFLHLEEPARALAEIVRVARPGGVIVVLDRDIETRTIDATNRSVTRRIVNFWCDSMRGGWVGRSLLRLFREAGLEDLSVAPFTVVDTDYDAFNRQYDLPRIVARAQAAGVLSAEEAQRWLHDVDERANRGSFFASMTCFGVSGRKPSRI
jgi:ubiquinone/menaquinone biosynthesis C-methylase UbiE